MLLCIPASSGCAQGIIPNFHFKNIAENPDLDAETRAWANETYWHMEKLLSQRTSAPGGEGITSSDDDSEFDNEQNPLDELALAEEEAALLLADNETPDPNGALQGIPATESQRRRRHRRQTTGPQRYIYEDYNRYCDRTPPHTLSRKEGGQPAENSEINLVYDQLGIVYDFYLQVFGRNSIDGNGNRLHGTAGYCQNFANAIWDGTQMLFGNGDGTFYNYGSFVRSLSVTGHEVTHGVIQSANPLIYQRQPGALNEHLADVFGILSELYHSKTPSNESSWLIGAGIPVGGGAIRSMKAPGTAYNTPALGKDPQPATMDNFYAGSADNYGVHINSGIPNHAFYLFSIAVGGYAYDTPGKIWYNVLTGGQGRFQYESETFVTFAQRTLSAAYQLYGGSVVTQLRQAWKQVGISL